MNMILNPGTGPVDGARERQARRNIGALCRDLALRSPHIRIERRVHKDLDGRYDYVLHRGIRSTTVSMPGLPLERVKLGPDDNPWLFPRLYVDGSSWLWPYAVNRAKSALLDHDGAAERGYQQSIADCNFVLANEPRCSNCGSIKDRYLTEEANPPYGYDRLRCIVCAPIEKTEIRSWNLESIYADDSWKVLQHGCVYRVTSRRVPYEALGTAEDPICTIGFYRLHQRCHLRQGHDGLCAPIWKEIERMCIELPYRGDA
jgi:hypothetical protein